VKFYAAQPRSGARMQPTAQAVGEMTTSCSPGGAKEDLCSQYSPPDTCTIHPRADSWQL